MTKRLVIFGLSISSSWGNGHAIPFRGLCQELHARDWQITFFERDVEWYRSNRDLSAPDYCDLRLYDGWPAAAAEVQQSDAVLVGSLVPNGADILDWLATVNRPLYFYDIDTPITLTGLRAARRADYLRADQIPKFDVYFSFTGGPALTELEQVWGARRAEALYCAVDPTLHRPRPVDQRFECLLGYMGTYAADRQPRLEALLVDTARNRPRDQFMIAGPQYPPMDLPPNVTHEIHLYPRDHAAFYSSNTATLNLTRDAMRRYGWSPASRLFEAAACGACIISDRWPGLEELLEPDTEILLADSRREVEAHLDSLTPARRAKLGQAARNRILREHTFARRAQQVEHALGLWASAS
ncbi:MAG TPA: glycosyltransferase [Chloroflexota bacterium]|nr:glycosyltransferase [Chloroflexota bacterium]